MSPARKTGLKQIGWALALLSPPAIYLLLVDYGGLGLSSPYYALWTVFMFPAGVLLIQGVGALWYGQPVNWPPGQDLTWADLKKPSYSARLAAAERERLRQQAEAEASQPVLLLEAPKRDAALELP